MTPNEMRMLQVRALLRRHAPSLALRWALFVIAAVLAAILIWPLAWFQG